MTISMIIHVSTVDYLASDTLGELKLHQQWHRPTGCKKLIIDKSEEKHQGYGTNYLSF